MQLAHAAGPQCTLPAVGHHPVTQPVTRRGLRVKGVMLCVGLLLFPVITLEVLIAYA